RQAHSGPPPSPRHSERCIDCRPGGVAESVGELRAVAEPGLPGSGRPLGQMVEVVARAVEGAELDPGQVKAARQQLPVFQLLTRQARVDCEPWQGLLGGKPVKGVRWGWCDLAATDSATVAARSLPFSLCQIRS